MALIVLVAFSSCERKPPLYLYDADEVSFRMPMINIDLNAYWNYELAYGITYDWKEDWYYGWDEQDRQIFGEIGYREPSVFNLRRYYTGDTPNAPHTGVIASTVSGRTFSARYDWGYWDILCWNEIYTMDGVQSLLFDENTSLDAVTAYTNPSMHPSRYSAPRYTRSFYEPEALFSAYETAIEVNEDLKGFEYDRERDVWVKQLNMVLTPVTYIYLTQIILHNNCGRVVGTDGIANLSGMARTTVLNTGQAGDDAITVYYNTRMKFDQPMVPYGKTPDATAEHVDIIGGRLMTFGICNQIPTRVSRSEDLSDHYRHYMDVNMQFLNGMDSTFVFDVTDQVRNHYKGGVITIELDMDTVPIPSRSGGSGFDAVVKDIEDGGTYEFDM